MTGWRSSIHSFTHWPHPTICEVERAEPLQPATHPEVQTKLASLVLKKPDGSGSNFGDMMASPQVHFAGQQCAGCAPRLHTLRTTPGWSFILCSPSSEMKVIWQADLWKVLTTVNIWCQYFCLIFYPVNYTINSYYLLGLGSWKTPLLWTPWLLNHWSYGEKSTWRLVNLVRMTENVLSLIAIEAVTIFLAMNGCEETVCLET